MARATRADVAKRAGVSLATVSHVMNGRAEELGFNKETAKRVEQVAKELGYTPRASARSFRYQNSKVIGLFFGRIPESLHLPVFDELLLSVVEQAASLGYYVLPVLFKEDSEITASQLLRSVMREVEFTSIICEYSPRLRSLESELDKMDVPAVWFNTGGLEPAESEQASLNEFPGGRQFFAGIDESAGVKDLLKSIDIGKVKNPVFLVGPGEMTARSKPFIECFPECRIVTTDSWLSVAGQEAMNSLLSETVPDLVFAANDNLALGAIAAFQENNLIPPRDFQIFGYGDVASGGRQQKSLSSIYWPLKELGQLVVNEAVSRSLEKSIASNEKTRTSREEAAASLRVAELLDDARSLQQSKKTSVGQALATIAHPRNTTLRKTSENPTA
ncbi:MAG: LacI family transcriptional regulator [Bifidobacteriaceae bacterium]|jgi:LacI family transcriptional regulator|nr:LacI family transcriptional regulator [Bifidobacteriaceae bacterium]